VAELDAIVHLTASIHGEWVRIHPFANGNGRTARVWAAWLALRYRLPLFVSVKPRPDDAAYVSASKASMGRPPDFAGDHTLTAHVFSHLLALSLLA
jgi:fido (protein-threonine AMPylation protein)